MSEKNIVFFIGTIAEYIKLFTVIEAVKKSGIPYKVIASGQNEIRNSDIARATSLHIDLQLSNEADITKNVFGLFYWFFKYTLKSAKTIRESFNNIDFENSIMVVHGDTLSTVMGAFLAKKLHMKLAHVEAGLRSRHWFTPFPEEIDRHIVSKMSDINFCQGSLSMKNLSKARGQSVDTHFNTIIDGLEYSHNKQSDNAFIDKTVSTSYGLFIMHRQENLMNRHLVEFVVNKAIEISNNKPIIFILHTITKNYLIKYNLLEKLNDSPNITLMDRLDYFDFMKLLQNSDFVITDGGSNQEELYYMGKPTLILRKATERDEGLGLNAVLYEGNQDIINDFIRNYQSYTRDPITCDRSPSGLIADVLNKYINNRGLL